MAIISAPGHRIQLIAGVLFTAIPLWLLAWHFRVRTPLFVSRHIPHHNAWTIDRETFIQEWMDNQIGNEPNNSAISFLCRQPNIKWQPDVVLDLDDANGGIGNVRGNIFDFLGLAILSGSSIVLPSFQSRSSTDLSALWNGKTPFSTFFDEDNFITTFAAACPKMTIYKPKGNYSLPPPLHNRYGMPSMRQDLYPDTRDTEKPNTPSAAVKRPPILDSRSTRPQSQEHHSHQCRSHSLGRPGYPLFTSSRPSRLRLLSSLDPRSPPSSCPGNLQSRPHPPPPRYRPPPPLLPILLPRRPPPHRKRCQKCRMVGKRHTLRPRRFRRPNRRISIPSRGKKPTNHIRSFRQHIRNLQIRKKSISPA